MPPPPPPHPGTPSTTAAHTHPLTCAHRFIGEWYEKEPGHDAPTHEQIATGSKNCFIIGAVYLGWMVFALGCVCVQSARAKRMV